jgi:hypothetical protein
MQMYKLQSPAVRAGLGCEEESCVFQHGILLASLRRCPDFYGLVTALCVAPLNAPPRPDAPAPRMNPNRASTYLEPKHENEVGGAKLMQEKYGAHIVMGAGDWDLVDQSVNGFPNGKPKRDIVATDGMKITLGARTVTLYLLIRVARNSTS